MISVIAGWSDLHVQSHSRNRRFNHAEGLCCCGLACQSYPNHVSGLHEVSVYCTLFLLLGSDVTKTMV